MRKYSSLVASLALFAVACGGGNASESPESESQTSEGLPLVGALDGTWCNATWPGCVTISSGGGNLSSGGDVCWRPGDIQYSGLAATGAPNQYRGTRYMYGSGFCFPRDPEFVTITVDSAGTSFHEVTDGGFSASWIKSVPLH